MTQYHAIHQTYFHSPLAPSGTLTHNAGGFKGPHFQAVSFKSTLSPLQALCCRSNKAGTRMFVVFQLLS